MSLVAVEIASTRYFSAIASVRYATLGDSLNNTLNFADLSCRKWHGSVDALIFSTILVLCCY